MDIQRKLTWILLLCCLLSMVIVISGCAQANPGGPSESQTAGGEELCLTIEFLAEDKAGSSDLFSQAPSDDSGQKAGHFLTPNPDAPSE